MMRFKFLLIQTIFILFFYRQRCTSVEKLLRQRHEKTLIGNKLSIVYLQFDQSPDFGTFRLFISKAFYVRRDRNKTFKVIIYQ